MTASWSAIATVFEADGAKSGEPSSRFEIDILKLLLLASIRMIRFGVGGAKPEVIPS